MFTDTKILICDTYIFDLFPCYYLIPKDGGEL